MMATLIRWLDGESDPQFYRVDNTEMRAGGALLPRVDRFWHFPGTLTGGPGVASIELQDVESLPLSRWEGKFRRHRASLRWPREATGGSRG